MRQWLSRAAKYVTVAVATAKDRFWLWLFDLSSKHVTSKAIEDHMIKPFVGLAMAQMDTLWETFLRAKLAEHQTVVSSREVRSARDIRDSR